MKKCVPKICFSRQKLRLPCKLNNASLATRMTEIEGKTTQHQEKELAAHPQFAGKD